MERKMMMEMNQNEMRMRVKREMIFSESLGNEDQKVGEWLR